MRSRIAVMRLLYSKTELSCGVQPAGRVIHCGWKVPDPRRFAPEYLRTSVKCCSSTADATNGIDGEVIDRELHEEARSSYLSYAMSVMVGRALPDVRDGLKPVHRRLLFSMDELKLNHNKPFRKSARVVGDVLGKYHPHGDQAIYDALVRMAQSFAMGERLVDGHGNFGSVDNDPAAAMRYTECRLQKLSEEMLLQDLDPAIVDFADNFDGSCQEPTVLPARIPQLLVNGSQGIAVGIATKVPPHNLKEVVAALQAYIADPSISDEGLQQIVKGPDFPTGAILLSTPGIKSTYETGKGSMTMRAKVHVEAGGVHGTRSLVVVTELPYQVPKATVIEEIAALVEKGTLTGISDIQDESDRTGMRVVIELKRGVDSNVVVNNLFKHSRLQTRFSANMVALVDNIPEQLTLRRILETFTAFRYQVIEKRAQQQLGIHQARKHIVEGFLLAVDDLESVVKTVRAAKDGKAARDSLQQQLSVSEEQADAVLNMSLRRLTGLAVGELQKEEKQLTNQINDLTSLLADPSRINDVMVREAQEISDAYGSNRRTELSGDDVSEVAAPEELVPDERCLVIFSTGGHIKRVKDDTFSTQRRGGKGKTGGKLRDNDAISNVLTVMSHDHLVCIASDGTCHTIRAFDVPERARTAKGLPMGELLPKLKAGVTVAAVVALHSSGDLQSHVMLLTRQGLAKRIKMEQLRQVRDGARVISLKDGDTLGFAAQCNEDNVVMVACSQGKVSSYLAKEIPVRAGRATTGVRAKNLKKGQHVVGACLVPSVARFNASTKEQGPWLLLAASDGLGKRVTLSEFRMTSRTAAGVIGIKLNPDVSLVNVHVVEEATSDDSESEDKSTDGEAVNECLLASSSGMMSRIALNEISVYGRTAKGLRITRLADTDVLSSITPCKYRHYSL